MSDVHSRLLVTTPPKPDESLTGYLVRLAGLNNYAGPDWILSMAGLDKGRGNWKWPSYAFCSIVELKRLGELLALDLPGLEELRYPPVETAGRVVGNHLFFGAPVPRSVIHPQSPKVCPECLKESRHCRRIWDFKLVTCCSTHQRQLIDGCPACGKRLKWYRPAASACDCGFDLRGVNLPPVNDPASRLSNMLCRLCGLPCGQECEDVRGDNPLATLNLEHAVTAALFVSSRITRRGKITGEGLAFLSNCEMHDLLLGAASIFEGWPDRFYDFIESRRSGRSGAPSLRRQFGEFYSSLFMHPRLSSASLDFFRRGFASYLESRRPRHSVRRVELNPKYINKTEAAERLGVSKKWLDRFISDGKIKTVMQKEWGVNQLLVEVDSVGKLREELRCLLGVKEVAELLGVPWWVVPQLAHAGCLTPARGPSVDGYRKLRFRPGDVETLVRGITSRLPEGDPLCTHCPDIKAAVKRFGYLRGSLVARIKAVLDGKVPPRKQPWRRKNSAPKMESLYLPF
jgi:hypothetical protein